MSQPLELQFIELLTDEGIANWRDQIQQVIDDPSQEAFVVFKHLQEQETLEDWRIPVTLKEVAGNFEIEWSLNIPSPNPDFIINTFESQLRQFKVVLDKAGTIAPNIQMELESTIDAFTDAASEQAAKIPFRVSIENESGIRRFQVEQTEELGVTFGGFTATLKNSQLTLAESSELQIDAEISFPGLQNEDDTGPATVNITLTQNDNLFSGTIFDLPPAKLNGLSVNINQLTLTVQRGNVIKPTSGSGTITFGFLDSNTDDAVIDLEVKLEDDNKIIYEAKNLDGKSFQKGPVSIEFTIIRVETQPLVDPNVQIEGNLRLEGADEEKNIKFAVTYNGPTSQFTFEGRYFPTVPFGFGTIELTSATLVINTDGDINHDESIWVGKLEFFNDLKIDVTVQIIDQGFVIGLQDSDESESNPLDFGPVGLEFRVFTLRYQNSDVESVTGRANLYIDGIEDEDGDPKPIGVTIEYDDRTYTIGLETNELSIPFGGFNLILTELVLSFNNAGLEYPFTFSGSLQLPEDLKDSNEDPVEIGVTVEVDEERKLTITGTHEPAIEIYDVPSVARLYLSMIQLSRINNEWGFGLGGKVENLIVIPGMDNLLPKEVNIRKLDFNHDHTVDLNFGVTWPSGLTIDFGGNEPGDFLVPVNGKFGSAVSLDALKISYGQLSATGGRDIGVLFMGAALKLGPVAAMVEGLGIKVELEKRNPQNSPGNFGVVNIRPEFVPPTGLAIALDTPMVTGGGYISRNQDTGEYAGAVELAIMNTLNVSAICVINSRMPDGRPGTSVLFIMSAEFTPGIALGFGFFLDGLGGIIGIHRTMQVDRLRDGVRTGTIKNILFPQDILSNLSRIISDIKDLFPIKRDQFIIGPLAAITWGVPTLMRIDVGLAVEFASPVRFGIFGVLRVILPDESTNLIRIQVAFLGMLDFEQKKLSFDASLYDSKILTFGLEGDMALRLGWGREKDFVLSVGGFHPRYNPPAHLHIPPMKRLTVKLLTGNPRLTLTSYFAVTSNTVQFGAAIDFHYSISRFRVIGEFGFDVLFQFSPFRFIADAHARLAVKAGSSTLLGISLQFSLEGPAPWRAKGTASFTILFITCKVNFDERWGQNRNTTLPNIAVLPLLLEALNDNRNWRSISKEHGVPGVRMKDPESTDDLILTPQGIIEVTQKVVPLERTIGKFGQFKPADHTRFGVKESRIGIQPANQKFVDDVFAPSHFLDVDDQTKLQMPSVEKHPAGIQVSPSGGTLKCGIGVNRKLKYQEIRHDSNSQGPIPSDNKPTLPTTIATFMMTHGAIRKSPFSNKNNLLAANFTVKEKAPRYVLVNTTTWDLTDLAFNTIMEAHEASIGHPELQIRTL